MIAFAKRTWALLYVAAVVGLGALSAVDPGGLRKHLRLEAEGRRLSDENREIRRENLRLRREARALAGESAALERAAREELGYVRPGEIVIQLDERGEGRP
jgi:cell division protein FtsB